MVGATCRKCEMGLVPVHVTTRKKDGVIMKFTGATDEQVGWAGGSDPRPLLTVGDLYEVERVEVHTWHTRIYLKDYPGMWFNSVCFEEQEGSGR